MPKNALCSHDESVNNLGLIDSILKGDYIFSSSTEQAQLAKLLIDIVFQDKNLEETLKRIDEVSEVLDFVHLNSSRDMTWLISMIHMLGKIIAYQTKQGDTISAIRESSFELDNGTCLKVRLEVYVDKFNRLELEDVLSLVGVESRNIYLEIGNKLSSSKVANKLI